MPILKNPKHEAFAQAVSGGMEATPAYRAIYGAKGKAAEVSACKLMAKVRLRVKELRKLADEVVTERLKFSKEDALQFLSEVIQTPIGEIDERSRLCQEYTVDEINTGGSQGKLRRGNAPEGNEKTGENILRTKVKMPGKLDAVKIMAAMCGWLAPEKVEHSGGITVSPQVSAALDSLGIRP